MGVALREGQVMGDQDHGDPPAVPLREQVRGLEGALPVQVPWRWVSCANIDCVSAWMRSMVPRMVDVAARRESLSTE